MTTKQEALKYISDLRDIQLLEHGNHTHNLPEWILIIENQLQKAKGEWYAGKDAQVLHRIAGIGACVCAAIEGNGFSASPIMTESEQSAAEQVKQLKNALKPFVDYAMKHGAVNLCGYNGAYLSAENWIEAGKQLTNNN